MLGVGLTFTQNTFPPPSSHHIKGDEERSRLKCNVAFNKVALLEWSSSLR